MKRLPVILKVVTIFLILAFGMNMSCAKGPFARPQGNSVASCRGVMKLNSGENVRFVFDVFQKSDGEFKAYVSFPEKGLRYKSVSDLSFDNGIMRVEIQSPKRAFEGAITGNDLMVTGEWNQYMGTFKFEIKQ